MDQLLDIPYWSDELKEGQFNTLKDLETALIEWEDILQQGLENYDYNTFGSYVDFYQCYKNSNQTLCDFILNYQAKITMDSMSCVAQSLMLIQNLTMNDNKFGSMFSLVSCEEMVMITTEMNDGKLQTKYQLESKDNVKEHVLVCLKVHIKEDNRSGYVLMDPGYHLSRPIVVMNDSLYPHTGWFIGSKNRKVSKEYCYQIINDQYIAWKVRETKLENPEEVIKQYVNMIYIQKEFAKYASVTEKRACIFSLKSYVIRNRKGAVAGFYSKIDEQNLTIFYEENDERVSHKFDIKDIEKQEVIDLLIKVAAFKKDDGSFNMDETINYFRGLLINYRESLYDEDFCFDLCEIDKWIEED